MGKIIDKFTICDRFRSCTVGVCTENHDRGVRLAVIMERQNCRPAQAMYLDEVG